MEKNCRTSKSERVESTRKRVEPRLTRGVDVKEGAQGKNKTHPKAGMGFLGEIRTPVYSV